MESLTRPFLLSQREWRVVLLFVLHHANTFSFYFIYFNAIVQFFTIIVETLTRFHLAQPHFVGGINSHEPRAREWRIVGILCSCYIGSDEGMKRPTFPSGG